MVTTHSTEDKSTLLAVVPRHIYETTKSSSSQAAAINKNQQFMTEYNVAVWLRFAEPPRNPVSIWLNYADAKGTKKVFVDKGVLNSAKHLMLSGKVAVRYKGGIENMKVTLSGDNMDKRDVTVDELYVQPIKATRALRNSISQV